MSRGGYCSKPSLGGSRILLSAPSLPYPTPSSKLPTTPHFPPSRETPLHESCTAASLSLSLASLYSRKEKERGKKEKKKKRESFPRKANRAHTRFADLFKRASLKRTRFTFIAVHSFTGRGGEEEKEEENEPRRDSTGEKGGSCDILLIPIKIRN